MSALFWTGGFVLLLGWFFWLPYQLKPYLSEGWIIAITFAPMPLSMLIGSFIIVLTRLLGGSLIIRSSSVLSRAASTALSFLRSDPFLLAVPAAGSLAVALTLAATAFWAFRHQPGGLSVQAAALKVVYSPAGLCVYLACGFALFLANAVVIHYYLQAARGEEPSLPRAAGASLLQAPRVLVLSLSVLLGLAALNRLVHLLREKLGLSHHASSLLEFAALCVEAGVFLGANLTMAAMFAGGVGLAEGVRRAADAARSRAGVSLKLVFGMATFRHETVGVLVIGPYGAGMLCSGYFVERAHPLTGAAIGFALGLILASIYVGVLQALEALFAAAVFASPADGERTGQPLGRALALLEHA